MKSIGETFAANVARLRKLSVGTQEDLAKKLGVTTATVKNYERNRSWPKNPEVMQHLATTLGVSVVALISGDGPLNLVDPPARISEAFREVKETMKRIERFLDIIEALEASQEKEKDVRGILELPLPVQKRQSKKGAG